MGSVLFSTEPLRLALVTETHNWKQAYAKALNDKCAQQMDSVMDWIDGLMKRLCRPIKDLDDVRTAMAGLNEIRESEVRRSNDIPFAAPKLEGSSRACI